MNNAFSHKEVYDSLKFVKEQIFADLAGSIFYKVKEDHTLSGNYNVSGIQFDFKIREMMKPDGSIVLPQTTISPSWLSAGSYFSILEVNIPNENKFSIQGPHNRPEDQVHLKKGKMRIILQPPTRGIENYGVIGSALFLQYYSEEKGIDLIKKARENNGKTEETIIYD